MQMCPLSLICKATHLCLMCSLAIAPRILLYHPRIHHTSLLRRRRRILIQNPLLHQLLRPRSLLDLLLQTIRTHVLLQFPLLLLQRGRSCAIRQNIAFDQFLFFRTLFEAFLEIVCGLLALQFCLGSLNCSGAELNNKDWKMRV